VAALPPIEEVGTHARLSRHAAAHRLHDHDSRHALGVGNVASGILVGRLDSRRAHRSYVDAIDREPVRGPGQPSAENAGLGDVIARHQHRTLIGEIVENLAVILANPGVVEGALLTERRRIAPARVERDPPRKRNEDLVGRHHHAGDDADEAVVGHEGAAAKPLRIAVRGDDDARLVGTSDLRQRDDCLSARPWLQVDDAATVR
jgi:hypothetical protein